MQLEISFNVYYTFLQKPAHVTLKPKKDLILMKEKKKQKTLEKEVCICYVSAIL